MPSDAMKPCPFCGGGAYVNYSDRGEIYGVRCNHWHGNGGSIKCMGAGAYAYTEEAAISAWNRRADEDRIASLESALASAKLERDEARELARAGFHEKHAMLYARAEAAESQLASANLECEQSRKTIADLREANERMRKALDRIERWFGEFPETGQYWDTEKTRPMSYAALFGSNGERDFMRAIARAALQGGNDG